MGATLPAIARWVRDDAERRVVARLLLRRQHRAAPCFGSLLAGFYLLRVYDMAVATYVAVALNVGRGGAGRCCCRAADAARAAPTADAGAARSARRARATVYVAIALSGMTALAARGDLDAPAVAVVRRDDLHVLADPRGLPDRPRHRQQRRRRRSRATIERPRVALGWCQMLLCGAIAWAAYMLTASLPYWPINPSISSRPVVQLPARPACAASGSVLPGRDSLGRELPAGAGVGRPRPGRIPARLVGGVYAANTVGAIVGSLVASLLLVVVARQPARAAGADRHRPRCRRCIMLAPAAAGDSERRPARVGADDRCSSWPRRRRACSRAACPAVPGLLVAYGRYSATWVGLSNIIYVGEGLNASVAVSETAERRAQLPQRRQGAGVERAAGHAPAAHARPPHDADPDASDERRSSSAAAPA